MLNVPNRKIDERFQIGIDVATLATLQTEQLIIFPVLGRAKVCDPTISTKLYNIPKKAEKCI